MFIIKLCVDVSSMLTKTCSIKHFLHFFICQLNRVIHRARVTSRDPLPVRKQTISLVLPTWDFVLMILFFMVLVFKQEWVVLFPINCVVEDFMLRWKLME